MKETEPILSVSIKQIVPAEDGYEIRVEGEVPGKIACWKILFWAVIAADPEKDDLQDYILPAIWDPEARIIEVKDFCSRDYIGCKVILYYKGKDVFKWVPKPRKKK